MDGEDGESDGRMKNKRNRVEMTGRTECYDFEGSVTNPKQSFR